MTFDLFDSLPPEADDSPIETLAPGAVLLRRFARDDDDALLAAVRDVTDRAPWRHLVTPGGLRMSVAMTNCGSYGWVSDRTGYRYDPIDPDSGLPWPPMPAPFLSLARRAASAAGYDGFAPDACLINRYLPGTRLSLHQDRDEQDLGAPIVSVSLGLPATFLFGGLRRADRPTRIRLVHGDVVVWGGPSRLVFHGIAPLADGDHPVLGHERINLTFRKAR
ncbi:DNA oxidative demethylase AlkB [Cupriavidus plantarum]|uniref:DNA oxidative demethylase AlkB n=1 Tax=Cupriavidus plantarum TaxID=942865 RepID=UPI000E2561F6|nr:DNA oxidative demethylase AlkB [Cupriavidus plantarum]REE85260.1 DNA-N1-methyladenine dioxygenase [Cupriavidus plantarum]RLK28552.1 DNA-N1-methyladenine dioxygenase [Cupriavidus plantarum]